jgi:hypothetical protein
MKGYIGVGAVALLVGLGIYLASPAKAPRPAKIPSRQSAGLPASTSSDPAEIFQKAFWKRPAADDKILHAERREWSDTAGVSKWQWFLVVEPAPALVKHLREDNAFSLVPATTVSAIKEAPAWFAFNPNDVEILQAPNGNMRLFFSKTKRLIYATGSGGGFQPGIPEAAKSAASPPAATGRLPLTPPPQD